MRSHECERCTQECVRHKRGSGVGDIGAFPGNSHGAWSSSSNLLWTAPGESASAAGMAAAVTTERKPA
jgi:hypothetical protein